MDDLIVQKYGGTSVGSVERIMSVAERVARTHSETGPLVVVLSAMGGETDRLLGLAQSIDAHCEGREIDALLSTGEQVSAALLSIALSRYGVAAVSLNGGQAGIYTDSRYNKARIVRMDTKRVYDCLDRGQVVVVTGFQGVDEHGAITTFGRGGSDTSAVALAVALKAKECHIYTDVDGVYTADPRVEPQASLLDNLTFEEMLEMSSLGSKVLQIRAVEFASKYNMPLRVLPAFGSGHGTLIHNTEENDMESVKISGVSHNRDEAQLTIIGVADKPGVAARILQGVTDENVEVDMIVQNVSEENKLASFTFTVHRRDYRKCLGILESLADELQARVVGNDGIVKVSVVGIGMRSHAGIAAQMFSTLAKQNINIHMISTSEIKISVVIDEKHLEAAVRALHQTFNLDEKEPFVVAGQFGAAD